MDTVNTGGPAFPRAAFEGETGFSEGQKGMTLRDYFAAKAMQAEISRHSYGIEDAARDVADAAYEYADAMLAAREVSASDTRWIEWTGGECPVAEGSLVDVRLRMGNEYFRQRAGVHEDKPLGYAEDWSHARRQHPGDIVAYRIVTP